MRGLLSTPCFMHRSLPCTALRFDLDCMKGSTMDANLEQLWNGYLLRLRNKRNMPVMFYVISTDGRFAVLLYYQVRWMR